MRGCVPAPPERRRVQPRPVGSEPLLGLSDLEHLGATDRARAPKCGFVRHDVGWSYG